MHMGKMGTIAAFSLLAVAVAAPGMAQQAQAPSCAPKVLENDGAVDISAGAWSAACVPGRGCSVSGPEVNGARMQFSRELEQKGWRVVLSLPKAADVMAGLQLALDGKAAENLPGEFLDGMAGGRAIAPRPEVAGVVLDMLRGAKRTVEWRYATKGGEKGVAAFSVDCLAEVMKAAEKRLAAMRAMKRLGK